MKKRLSLLALGIGIMASAPATSASYQETASQDQEPKTQPAPDTMKQDQTKPDQAKPHKMGPGKMGAVPMNADKAANGSTSHNHLGHKTHKKGHKMPEGTTPPDKTPGPSQ